MSRSDSFSSSYKLKSKFHGRILNIKFKNYFRCLAVPIVPNVFQFLFYFFWVKLGAKSPEN